MRRATMAPMTRTPHQHSRRPELHRSERVGWLRAAVLGANDGIVSVAGLVVVMDIRHPLKDYDRQMIGYAVARGLPAHALLTKADKLGRGQQTQALAAVRRELAAAWGADTVSVQTFSSESKQGVDEARAIVAGWLEL